MRRGMNLNPRVREYWAEFYRILQNMIREMDSARLGESISYNFIVQMIPHHQAAIDMSKNLLKYTNFVTLEDIAERIIKEQTQSIENMEAIKEQCREKTNTPQELGAYQNAIQNIKRIMFSEMGNAYTTNSIDGDFMREMIPHHMGAVRMSRITLEYPICPELVPILEAIIASQERGIIQMQQLLRCGCF